MNEMNIPVAPCKPLVPVRERLAHAIDTQYETMAQLRELVQFLSQEAAIDDPEEHPVTDLCSQADFVSIQASRINRAVCMIAQLLGVEPGPRCSR